MSNLSQVMQPSPTRSEAGKEGVGILGRGQRQQSGASLYPPGPPLQDELAPIRAHRQLVFRYHVVGCRQLRSQELLDEGYVTTLSGHTLRIHEREVGPGPAPTLNDPETLPLTPVL